MKLFYLALICILFIACNEDSQKSKTEETSQKEEKKSDDNFFKRAAASFVQYRDITSLVGPKEFHRLIQECDTVLILDVRPREVWKSEARIKGAISTANYMLFQRIMKGKNKDQQIMVYCGKELRSPGTVEALVRMGFNNVYELKGGLRVWKELKLPLVTVEGKPI